jgi:hypothetical protein
MFDRPDVRREVLVNRLRRLWRAATNRYPAGLFELNAITRK